MRRRVLGRNKKAEAKMPQQIKAWERQPKESAQAYEAFAFYRDLGAERSLVKVRQEYGKNLRLIERWSREWKWVERIRGWDNDIAACVKKEAASMAQRHLKIALQIQSKAEIALNDLKTKEMNARDIACILKLGIDIERIIRGEPTERTENKATFEGNIDINLVDLSILTDEELENYAALSAKARGETPYTSFA